MSVATLAFLGDSGAALRLTGCLDAGTVARAWGTTLATLRARVPRKLVVDAHELSLCDGAGIGLLVEVDRIVKSAGGTVEFRGLSPDLRRLLGRALLPPVPSRRPDPPRPFVERLGRGAAGVLEDARFFVAFLGELAAALAWAVSHPRRVRARDVLLAAQKSGVDAVPVVCLLGWLMGLIIALQSVRPLERYGATSTIPTLLAISMIRELGPLVTAVILAGRTGSALAAELGSMKVTEEIDALRTLSLEPVRFLVVPRVMGAVVVTPFLSLFATFAGLVGGYVVMALLGFPPRFFTDQVQRATRGGDLLHGFSKGFVFAFLVAGIGCAHGLRTGSGPGAVGASTTRAVVAGIVLIVVADGVLGFLGYVIGR